MEVYSEEARASPLEHLIRGSWFRFPAHSNLVFHPCEVDELMPDLTGKNESLIFYRLLTVSHCMYQILIQLAYMTSR